MGQVIPTAPFDRDLELAARPYILAAIGRELRATYADIIAEGMPERFAEILRTLDGAPDGPEKDSRPQPQP